MIARDEFWRVIDGREERWTRIEDFPLYEVSDMGRIYNNYLERFKGISVNFQGHAHVGLSRGGQQFRRSLALLVAEAFLPAPWHRELNTPQHRDGDLENCDVFNLDWRPRGYAMEYHRLVRSGVSYFNNGFLYRLKGEDEALLPWNLMLKYGLLEKQIVLSALNGVSCWPDHTKVFERVW